MYNNLLKYICSLSVNTKFSITIEFCNSAGIVGVTNDEVRGFGKQFRKDYKSIGCIEDILISPQNGAAAAKSSDNLYHYIKK